MTKKIVGLFATVALLSSGLALANDDDKQKSQQTQSSEQMGDEAIGGSGAQGQMGHMDHMKGEKHVTGTVVKSSSNELFLRTDNGVLPVKINKDTKFEDPSVKRAKDLKEGQQIRASFDIQGTENIAKSITLDTSMGGSGLEDDTGIDLEKDKDLGGDVGGSGDVKY